MNRFKQAGWLLLLAISVVLPVQASDSAKEQRWANQIADFLVDGEQQWLDANGQKFLAIYTPAAGNHIKGAVILLHGRGTHPDWPQVIQPLRTQLPEQGWATLSLQMPVLHNGATYEDYIPLFKEVPARIDAGLGFLSKQGVNNIVLLGHSLGTNMATDYLVNHPKSRIQAFVGIGMMGNPQPAEYQVLDNVAAMLQMKVPVLDIYGSQTYSRVLRSVDRRAFAVYHTGNHYSRQFKIDDANHFFQGHEEELLQAVTNWMAQFALPKQIHQFTSTANSMHSK